MGILTFIIDNILINAAMVLGIVALLGLILQKKSAGACFSGTFKTMMGFMILEINCPMRKAFVKISLRQ